jgi:hypothetical protein
MGLPITNCGERQRNKEVRVTGMNMFWMVEVLGATLCVVAVSFAAAVAADAVSGRSRDCEPDRAETAGSHSESRVLTIEASRRERDWHRVAIRAWVICVAASVIAVTFVGVLIIVG